MESAFVLGNGKTRLELGLEILRGKGKIYGCNYLYQEFPPDVLVATDKPIATEIQKAKYCRDNVMYTRDPFPNSCARKIPKNWAYSSGPVAITLACLDNHNYIYMIVVDLMGIDKNKAGKRLFNNVYADQKHYKKSDREETHYGNWVEQTTEIMKEYKDRTFIRVNPHLDYNPPEWEALPNYQTLTLIEFLDNINTL